MKAKKKYGVTISSKLKNFSPYSIEHFITTGLRLFLTYFF